MFVWTLFGDGEICSAIYVRDDCDHYNLSENRHPWPGMVKEFREHHPELSKYDMYFMSSHGPRHEIYIIDVDGELLVTAPHEVTLKLLGIPVSEEEKFPFSDYKSALTHLLKAAQEDYEAEMEWRRKTGNYNEVLHK